MVWSPLAGPPNGKINMSHDVVRIQQRLQDRGKFLFIATDDALFLIAPIVIGLIGRHPILGAAIGVLSWLAWSRLKGERGLEGLIAAVYWWFPSEAPVFKGFPPSHVQQWRG